MSELKEIAIDISNVVPDSEKQKPIWERGYNKEYDIIVISHTKRIGKIYDMDGMRIALPEVPHKSQIYNSEETDIYKQYWERKPLPDDLLEIEEEATEEEENESIKDKRTPEEIFMSRGESFVRKYKGYIAEEWRRRREGFWFMNGGEPQYVTGGHYMFMQWSFLQDSYYPKYRFPQWVIWCHWEACKVDSRSFGQCYGKNRRSGYSTISMSDNVDYGTQHKSVLVGIISKSGDDAQEAFMEMVTPVFANYPFFFKPTQDGTTNPRRELAFRQISKRITAKNRGGSRSRKGNNSKIRWWPTKKNSMDGKEVNKMSGEEVGKWPADVPIDKYWPIAKKCLLKGRRKVGKAMFGSTVNAPEEGGSGFKTLYYWSKEETRSKVTGETISGLNSLFIPAQYNLEGFFDIWGNPILYDSKEGIPNEFGEKIYVGSISYLEEVQSQLRNDPDALNQQRRLDPTTERDMFLTPSENCLFNQEKIEDQIHYNDSKFNNNTKRSTLYKRGNLVWVIKNKKVAWEDNKKGKWLMSYPPTKELENNISIENGKLVPGNAQYFVGGCDSYDISGTVSGAGSKGSLHIYAKNAFTHAPNQFVLEYCDRPQTAEMFFDNVIKSFIYYGCPILAELNKPRLLYEMKERGFRKFSINRPDKKLHQLSITERELGGVTSTGANIPTQAEAVELYIERHVGVNINPDFGEIGSMGNCFFNDLLIDWLKFDISKRTLFDRTVSSSLALWADQRIMLKNPTVIKPHIYTRKQREQINKRS